MSAKKCTVCGESSIIQEEEGAVCMNCGTVHSELQTFVSDSYIGCQNPVFTQSQLPLHAWHLKGKREQPTMKRCRAKLQSLCVKLSFGPEMIEAANSLLLQATQYKEFKCMYTYNKILLSHCCVYITGRQFNFPITIKEFCFLTRQSVSDVAKLHQRLISKLHIDIQYQSIASLMAYHLSDSVFNRECLDMVKDILKLYERKRTSSSPHRDVTLGLAAYLAWGSMNLVEYSNCRIKQFAKKHKFIFTPVWGVRLKELNEILTDVGSRLPWISNTSTKHFVVKHLKDILQFQNSLLLKEMMESDSEEEDEKTDSDCTSEDKCESMDEKDECEKDKDQNGQECMYMIEVPDNDSSNGLAGNENLNVVQTTLNQDESVCVELEPATPKIPNCSDFAGKTFVYHSTFRVITADLPTK
ncbi:transcription factor IIIB 50 kDa subunit-like [Pecten maximus]|uniref:transcription factor IIIB 50 kDa subunit-like n=1 Tax=Pecten maximus TaxID=6579 RepID=UPI001458E54D|nr:transcription factor IIIB 50 kDa subunit-like [Pecten maximus]